ncbi:MAG: hypothetical protein ACRDJE_18140, partial [Dehalococcoidia bacterium]
MNQMPITPRCTDAAALLAGLPAREADAALAAHRVTCATCQAALAALHDELTEELALGDLLAARAATRAEAGRPLRALQPVVRRTAAA